MTNQELEKLVVELQGKIAGLEKQVAARSEVAHVPRNRIAAGITAREAWRDARDAEIRAEIANGKTVRCRVERSVERRVQGGVVQLDISQPIALSHTWKRVWPEAPAELRAREDDMVKGGKPIKGAPIIHTLPERVYESLKEELVKV